MLQQLMHYSLLFSDFTKGAEAISIRRYEYVEGTLCPLKEDASSLVIFIKEIPDVISKLKMMLMYYASSANEARIELDKIKVCIT
jgi:hypothetical protein